MSTVTARLLVALDAANHVPAHERNLDDYESATVTGEGPNWEAAKAAVKIPDGALPVAWFRDE